MFLSGFPGGSDGKESPYSVGDLGSIPGLGRSPGGGNGNTLQYSCLENSMQGGAWRATVHGIPKSRTWLSDFLFFFFFSNVSLLTKATKWNWKPYLIYQSRFDAGYRKIGAGALGWPRGMGWGGRWEGGSGWGTRVHLWWMHVDVWQNKYNIVK